MKIRRCGMIVNVKIFNKKQHDTEINNYTSITDIHNFKIYFFLQKNNCVGYSFMTKPKSTITQHAKEQRIYCCLAYQSHSEASTRNKNKTLSPHCQFKTAPNKVRLFQFIIYLFYVHQFIYILAPDSLMFFSLHLETPFIWFSVF